LAEDEDIEQNSEEYRKWRSGNDNDKYASSKTPTESGRGDRTNLIRIFWEAYRNQHRPSVEGGRDSMRLSPRQAQLEAF
jgi:hypothetical protein